MKKYMINEIFLSLQGEGINAGRAAVFVRFSGCNLKCPFCDTNFKEHVDMDVETIVSDIKDCLGENPMPRLCVFTGGEPTLQLDDALIDAIHGLGMEVAVETNGTGKVPDGVDFITVSPKSPFVGGKASEVVLEHASEVKVVMTEEISVEEIRAFETIKAHYYFIQPCDTGFIGPNKRIMQRCVKFVECHPNWRLSLQQQKILNVR